MNPPAAPCNYDSVPSSSSAPPPPSPPPRLRPTLQAALLAALSLALIATVALYARRDATHLFAQRRVPARRAAAQYCPCPRIYAPVCCMSAAGFATKPNACECVCSDLSATVVSDAQCAVGLPPTAAPKPLPNCACPMIYMPVCCASPTGNATAPNACMCECPGGRVEAEGPC
eukprot:gb/GEZJ01001348.1/.p2 GENE.gb/GEZJ01001348.1/~~gb/GEZJ01001348.1/.p2  ORF type:complete len:173 (-),score=6.49 gb/GEZJ01001348.1/:263-781(-)